MSEFEQRHPIDCDFLCHRDNNCIQCERLRKEGYLDALGWIIWMKDKNMENIYPIFDIWDEIEQEIAAIKLEA